ncbi:PBSX family phage terminase large subunit [Clostridiaceae bacterium OttesenSCG-928-D20]|nr:PBSX family phage terminase large subunit [Clostridiaceae bacterium OttesenSCG-928-D20]
MRFQQFSKKQLSVLNWWTKNSPHRNRDAIICDGAVRSGKTLCMSASFVIWAMSSFSDKQFGLCGKTIISLRRNVLETLLPFLKSRGFQCEQKISKNLLTVRYRGRENSFYLFGGKDEASQSLIQGSTFAGVLLDEVALMPRSFVEQALARCSVGGSKIWFNCNPEGPDHWFYNEWIKKAREKNALYLHFTMEDNPSLSDEIIERYKRQYSGVFYRRFVLGQWVVADGRVYDFFDESYVQALPEGDFSDYIISCDYGTANPSSFGLWGRRGEIWYRISEYYYDSRAVGSQKTDEEYADELLRLSGGRNLRFVIVDPSAASFIECLRRRGLRVVRADNDVLSGIRLVASLLQSGKIVICESCKDAIREFSLYRWADKAAFGTDAPLKQNDHAMDDIRYFAKTVLSETSSGNVAFSVERKTKNK